MIASVAIPALVALLSKVVLLGYSLRSLTKNSTTHVLLALLVVVVLQNVVEFVGLTLFTGLITPYVTFSGFAYFALTILAIAPILHLSIHLSLDPSSKSAGWHAFLYVPPAILLYLLLATDYLVLGFQPFKNTILRIPGPWYFLFESYLVLYPVAALSLLAYGARGSRPSALGRARTRLWLFGLLPAGVLMVYLIVANHYGVAKLTSTIYFPLTLTFFLALATYAVHQYRLFDVAYFLPWSQVRKRKIALYKNIQRLAIESTEQRPIGQILEALAETIHCPVALIGGPQPLVAGDAARSSGTTGSQPLTEFPRTALKEVHRIVVVHEVIDTEPMLYALMKRHQVGAIVPINAHSPSSVHWMLFGERFSDHVYTPRDFRIIEALFDRISQRFSHNLHELRAQLTDAHEEIQTQQRRLAILWDELSHLREAAALADEHNRELKEEKTALRRELLAADAVPKEVLSGDKTLEQYLHDTEREIVLAALRHAGGSRAKAARLLGLWSENALHYLLVRHGLDPTDYT